MKTVNIHEAKTQLSKLIEKASKGEPFVIAKAGKPVVKVTAFRRSNRGSRTEAWFRGGADIRAERLIRKSI
jgi:prevent-host-death family protein